MVTVWVRGRQLEVCRRSLFLFPIDGWIRQSVLSLVERKAFDFFILFFIMVNSVLLACYQYRASGNEAATTFNRVVDDIIDPIFTLLFTLELLLKIVAWGALLDRKSYLRDPWNWLDAVVVCAALIKFLPGVENSGLGFLRVFRALRPLRSLNAVPQMKHLVITVISSVPRLGNVAVMGVFLALIFGIVGIMLMDGVMYHRCRTLPAPVLDEPGGSWVGVEPCWSWPYEPSEGRLCGGRYLCEASGSYCGSANPEDANEGLRPRFPGGGGSRGLPWCAGSEPRKLAPETDFLHFEHIGGALMVVFQSMTLEGWTEIMYMVQDGFDVTFATIYFFSIVLVTNYFLLNVALAVVDEALADAEWEEEKHEKQNERNQLLFVGSLAQGLHQEEQAAEEEEEEAEEVEEWSLAAIIGRLRIIV